MKDQQSSRLEKLANRKCQKCGCTLRLIGRDRQKGCRRYSDWQSRKLHRKCFIQNLKQNSFKSFHQRISLQKNKVQ